MQGLIPDWGTKIPHATLYGKNNTKQEKKKKTHIHVTSGVKENWCYHSRRARVQYEKEASVAHF